VSGSFERVSPFCSRITKGLDAVLRIGAQRSRLFGTVGFTVFLYVIIPKDFPAAGHRRHLWDH